MEFLSRVRNYNWLTLGGVEAKFWLPHVSEARVVCLFSCPMNQEQLETFLSQHPEVETINIPNNRDITDLTKLLSMPNLHSVAVSQDMKKAIQSIEGMELPFNLSIW